MGSSTLLDIVGSVIIGGFMLLILHTLNQSSAENSSKYSGDLITQQNLVSIIELLEYDFARLGYCEDPNKIPDADKMITYADSTKIIFWTDFGVSQANTHGDSTLEQLCYELGPDINETPNPKDKILYRYKVGSPKDASNLGITLFNIHYYDNFNNELAHPIDTKIIAYMQIELRVEDCYGYDSDNPDKLHSEKFPTTFWRQIRLANKNMNR